MATVFDVADALLQRFGSLDTIKLQKLVFYCQAWNLAWLNEPLFDDEIQAWDNGPVVRELFNAHRGAYAVSGLGRGDAGKVPDDSTGVVEFVAAFYGDKSGSDLVAHVHEEDPWYVAYHDRGRNSVIGLDEIRRYYATLEELNEQAWVWISGAYQDIQESEAEIARGETTRHGSTDDFLSALG